MADPLDAKSLRRLCDDPVAARAGLGEVVRALKVEEPSVREVAAMVLARLGADAVEAAGALADAIARPCAAELEGPFDEELSFARRDPDYDPWGALAAIRELHARTAASGALAKMGPAASASIGRLGEAILDRRGLLAVPAARALAWTRGVTADVLAALERGRVGRDSFVRAAAASAHGELGPLAAPALPALRSAASDWFSDVQVAVARAIWRAGGTAAEVVPPLVRALAERAPSLRQDALFALAEVGPAAEAAVPALAEAVAREGDPLRFDVVLALAAIGPGAAPAIEGLVRALGDRSLLVREKAAWALGRIGPAAGEALGALGEAEADPYDPSPDRGYRFIASGREYAGYDRVLIAADGVDASRERVRTAVDEAVQTIRGLGYPRSR